MCAITEAKACELINVQKRMRSANAEQHMLQTQSACKCGSERAKAEHMRDTACAEKRSMLYSMPPRRIRSAKDQSKARSQPLQYDHQFDNSREEPVLCDDATWSVREGMTQTQVGKRTLHPDGSNASNDIRHPEQSSPDRRVARRVVRPTRQQLVHHRLERNQRTPHAPRCRLTCSREDARRR